MTLQLIKVGKRYGRGRWVLGNVDVTASGGQVVAFRGGNGSGKSTLLRIVSGVSKPTTGTVTGRPPVVGYVPDRFTPNGRLSAMAYLTHLGRIRGLTARRATVRGRELLTRLALVGGPEAQLRTLSKGNAQKVALAQALLVPPDLLVLDEPWSGLDASVHGVLADIIAEVAARGGAVVFTDHRESVTHAYATHTYLVRDGRVSPMTAEASTVIVLTTRDRVPTTMDWRAMRGVRSVGERGRDVIIHAHREHSDALLATALRAGWSVTEVTQDGRSTS